MDGPKVERPHVIAERPPSRSERVQQDRIQCLGTDGSRTLLSYCDDDGVWHYRWSVVRGKEDLIWTSIPLEEPGRSLADPDLRSR